MILRRLYLYLVSAAALVVLAAGLVLLGGTSLLFAFNDPGAETSRGQLAIFTAMTVVALPVWGVHFWFALRFASRDPFERASALRRLYLYWACLGGSIAAMIAVTALVVQLVQPYLDNLPLNALWASQIGWAAVVFAAIWGFHFYIAWRDRAAAGEEGTSSTLRRWYMYVALLVGVLTLLAGTASLLQIAWTKLATDSPDRAFSLAGPAGLAVGLLRTRVARESPADENPRDSVHEELRTGTGERGHDVGPHATRIADA